MEVKEEKDPKIVHTSGLDAYKHVNKGQVTLGCMSKNSRYTSNYVI